MILKAISKFEVENHFKLIFQIDLYSKKFGHPCSMYVGIIRYACTCRYRAGIMSRNNTVHMLTCTIYMLNKYILSYSHGRLDSRFQSNRFALTS